MNEWLNPNESYIIVHSTSVRYARSFIEKGQIKFGTPKEWEQYVSIGRGDPYEGTQAFANVFDPDNILQLNKKYPDSERMVCNGRTLFKNKRSMKLPCFCMYALKMGDFTSPTKEGWQKVSAEIPASYFDDFVDHKTKREIEKEPELDRPAIIVISNFPEFERRLCNYLDSINGKTYSLEKSLIDYYDFEMYGKNGWIDLNVIPPNELFFKSTQYATQSEARLIIDTDDEVLIERLMHPIELGTLSDIAQISEHFFEYGINVEMNVNAYAVDDK